MNIKKHRRELEQNEARLDLEKVPSTVQQYIAHNSYDHYINEYIQRFYPEALG